jgi:hypothetical protein
MQTFWATENLKLTSTLEIACDCNPEGSLDQTCDPDDGQCECGNKFGGRKCDQCERGYFGYPNCKCKRDKSLCLFLVFPITSNCGISLQIVTAMFAELKAIFVTRVLEHVSVAKVRKFSHEVQNNFYCYIVRS